MNTKGLIIAAVLFAFGASALRAEEPQRSDSLHTKVWSVYVQGGGTMAAGPLVKSVNPSRGTAVSALYGLGGSYNFFPWLRVSLNYEFTKYAREQRFTQMQAVSTPKLDFADMKLEELFGGKAYHKTWTSFHDLDATADFNIMEIWNKRKTAKWLNIWFGTGIGVMFAGGNSYDVAMGYEHWSDPSNFNSGLQVGNRHEIYSWVDVNNDAHKYTAPYIPANLAVEFDVAPFLTLGVKGMYRYVISKQNFSPDHVMGAALTIRYNFTGRRHGYITNKQRHAALAERYSSLDTRYRSAVKDCEDRDEEIKRLSEQNKALQEKLSECEARPVAEPVKVETSVQFAINSDKIEALEELRLREFLRANMTDGESTIQLTAEASLDGTQDYNQRLSERRLESVVAILKSYGIDESRISYREAIGSKEYVIDPIARRVTIRLD